MAVPSVLTQLGVVASATTSIVVLAILVGLVYRWHSGATDEGDTEEGEQSGMGFPLASWRYVYDVDKADANREIASVQQEAEDLAEADREARR